MIKLIASDIDGTLLQNGETEISPRFFREAERLMKQGWRFAPPAADSIKVCVICLHPWLTGCISCVKMVQWCICRGSRRSCCRKR